MSSPELTRETTRNIASLHSDGAFHFSKISLILGIILEPTPDTPIDDIRVLMVAHAAHAANRFPSGTLAPVMETMQAVRARPRRKGWRPETITAATFRAVQEELGRTPDEITLQRAKPGLSTWAKAWKRRHRHAPHKPQFLYGLNQMVVTSDQSLTDLSDIPPSAYDSTEIIGAEWMALGDLRTMAAAEPRNFRPGVRSWADDLTVRLEPFLEDWHDSPRTLRPPATTEPLCDLRFTDPNCLRTIGVSALRGGNALVAIPA